MIKKVLFILFLLVSTVGFSQKSLTKLAAVPNPFVSETAITFESNKNQVVTLSIRNVLGKIVHSKRHQVKRGKNSIPFYKNDLRSGMYIYAIQNNRELISKRFVIK